jgi:signal transduction histidine kinase
VLVDDLCRSSLAFINSQAVKKSIEVSYENDTSIVSLSADPRRVKQILINLLSNAVKFTPRGGSVKLSGTVLSDGWLDISVSDTGIGIAEEDIWKALVPFAQVSSDLSRKYEGTGLGLPLSKGFVEMHGGTLKIDSEPGRGTTVTVRFPPDRTRSVSPENVRAQVGNGADRSSSPENLAR